SISGTLDDQAGSAPGGLQDVLSAGGPATPTAGREQNLLALLGIDPAGESPLPALAVGANAELDASSPPIGERKAAGKSTGPLSGALVGGADGNSSMQRPLIEPQQRSGADSPVGPEVEPRLLASAAGRASHERLP